MRTPEAYVEQALLLPDDATILPYDSIAPEFAAKLGAVAGEVAVSRAKSRFPAKIVSAELGEFLSAFRRPRRIADVVVEYANRHDVSALELLDEVFPILKELVDSSFLVSEDAASNPTELRFAPGDRLGAFTIVRPVQVLDDTAVYGATSTEHGFVALKIARLSDVASVKRLRAEAETLRTLEACRVARIVAYEESRTLACLATRWLAGVCIETWADGLRETEPGVAGRRATLAACVDVAAAYAAIHETGVVHGDVHPKNVFILRDLSAAIVDFGLARHVDGRQRSRRGGVGFYFEPEYALARLAGEAAPAATFASEQFSLGALFFRLLTGSYYLSFSFEKDAAYRQIAGAACRSFAAAGSEPWLEVETVLHRMLSLAPDDRFASVGDVVRALQAAQARPIPATGVADPQATITDYAARTVRALRERVEEPMAAPHAAIAMGASGAAYGAYRMALHSSDPALLDLADRYAELAQSRRGAEGAFYASDDGLTEEALTPHSVLYAGPGVSFVRALVAHARGDAFGLNTAILDFTSESSGADLHKLDYAFGPPGVLSGCADLVRIAACHSFVDALPARDLGTRMRDAIIDAIDALRPGAASSPHLSGFMGAAHGWAGTLHAVLKWHEVTREPLAGIVRETLDVVAGLGVPVDRGMRWPRKWPVTAPEYFSSWCNGSAGFVHLWLAATRAYPGGPYAALAEDAVWSTFDATDTALDLCCGAAGRVYALLAYAEATHDETWRTRAIELAALAVRKAKPARFMRQRALFKGDVGLAVACGEAAAGRSAMPMFANEP